MRVDADLDKEWGRCAAVFVDGVQSMRCVMADEELGVVEEEEEAYVQGPGWDVTRPYRFPTRMRWGKVEIRAAEGLEEEFGRLKQRKRMEAEARP